MPELPEVETVRRFLAAALLLPKPKKIKDIRFLYPSAIKEIEPKKFHKALVGQSFTYMDRYGKFLLLKLETHTIISHLRMEGKYAMHPSRPEIKKADILEFIFTDGSCLVFSDVRKFGTIHLVKKGEEMKAKCLAKLGPEVNGDDFTFKYLQEVCQKRDKSIKDLLLDQDIVSGIGNIYADEILYAAKVHPETKCSNVSDKHLRAIVTEGKKIIQRAILNKGTTFRSFSSNNEQGSYQHCLKVYGKPGIQCECGDTITKIRVAQRGTHYCPTCQVKQY